MRYYTVIGLCIFCWFVLPVIHLQAQVIPFDSGRWEINGNNEIREYKGKTSLYLQGGAALIKDLDFLNGIIEFDISFSETRNFTGAMFRWQDARNFEDFYLRPHMSGSPDANQYTPVYNGVSGWQLYHGEAFSAPTKYNFDGWNHVKIVVSGKRGEVFINDMSKPAVVISQFLRETRSGKVGFKAGGLAPAYYANFSVTNMDNPTLTGEPKGPVAEKEGIISSWQISNTFEQEKMIKQYKLDKKFVNSLKWKELKNDFYGAANIAALGGIQNGKNTVLARIRVNSEKDQTKRFQFGYSDAAMVYVNGKLIYRGNNVYQTRDYRYLGTIGLFDSVYLDLKSGANEVVIAVAEGFGGWGVKGFFEDISGISFGANR